jgi:hypothetical protein
MITCLRKRILQLIAAAGCQIMYQLRNVFKNGLQIDRNFFIPDFE